MKKSLSHLVLIFLLAACSGGTGTAPLDGVPGGAGLGQGGPVGGPGNAAAPEQDSGVVYPSPDPEEVVIQIQCEQAKCTYNEPIAVPEGESPDPSGQDKGACIEFKAHLGRYLNDFTPCCNGRVVRFVDPILGRYIDYETKELDGFDGGFEPKLPVDHAVKITVYLAPETFVSPTVGQWQDCNNDCVPDAWSKFDNPWGNPTCAFMHSEFSGDGAAFEAIHYQEGFQALPQALDSED